MALVGHEAYMREEIDSYRFGNLKERDLLEDPGLYWRIMLTCILRSVVEWRGRD
jgi:hypothetical protein